MNPANTSAPCRPAVRKAVTVPGLLEDAIAQRQAEFEYPSFSPFALELVCFDLRARRAHSFTRPLSRLAALDQEDIDREIVRRYRPGSTERQGALIELLLHKALQPCPAKVRGSFRTVACYLRVPAIISDILPIRVKELRYDSFSAYLTGLIRYDLMLGGPHKHFSGKDTDPAYLRELDEWTVRTFQEKQNRKTFVDYELERIQGREMTPSERNWALRDLANRMCSPSQGG